MSTARWRLVVVSDFAGRGYEESMARLRPLLTGAQPGSVLVQLRDRGWSPRARLEAGLRLRRLTREARQGLCTNDRLDLAVLMGADAVHLPQQGLSAQLARRFLAATLPKPDSVPVFQAVHDVDAALRSDADAVVLSPALAPRKGRPALGIKRVREASRRLRTLGAPALYVLGGVGAPAARELLDAGVQGVAVQGALFEPIFELLDALGIAKGRPA